VPPIPNELSEFVGDALTDDDSFNPDPPPVGDEEASLTVARAKKPHFHNHRERLRDKALRSGGHSLHDYELMELLLFRAILRRDVKQEAKALIQQFGDVWGVLNANPDHVAKVPGIGKAVSAELRIVRELVIRAGQDQIMHKPIVDSWSKIVAYCRSTMANAPREQVRVLFVDVRKRLIADEVMNEGTVDQAPVYPREVVRRALELNASALVLVHNHPSGDPSPSEADVLMTRAVITAGAAVSVSVIDHLIIGKSGVASLKQLGLMP